MFQDDRQSGKFVIDDFQENTSPTVASSGAAVSNTVIGFTEGSLDDNNLNFNWQTNDPFNGFLMDSNGAFRSNSNGCVFQFADNDADITYTLQPGQNDFRDFEFLSFRSGQGTRHPITASLGTDVSFSVTLEDGAGNQGTVDFAAYGAGLETPYQRAALPTCGNVGVGWTSEFETIQIRLSDFTRNGSGVDLADVQKVIFNFGRTYGSPAGRLGLDEIELTVE